MSRLLLRNIDPKQVLISYAKRDYSKLKLSDFERLIVVPKVVIDNSIKVPEKFKSNQGVVHVIIVNPTKFQAIRHCHQCRAGFNHDPIGIPLAMEKYQESSIDDPSTRTADNSLTGTMNSSSTRTVYKFICEGCYCDDECCLEDIAKLTSMQATAREVRYAESETLLRLMHYLMYPDAPQLERALDFKLLDINDGPLTREEYKSNSYRYTRTTKRTSAGAMWQVQLEPAEYTYLASPAPADISLIQ